MSGCNTPETQKCSQCGIEKELNLFHKCKQSKNGYRKQCKQCRIYICKKDYSTNLIRWKRRDEKATNFLWELKNKPCADCGNTYHPVCMDFDHRDPSKKVSDIAKLRHNKKILSEEIEKCDIVCSNCHRLRTHNKKLSGFRRNKL